MPLNATEIARISKVAHTAYGKNKPVDQINVERPLSDLLIPKAKPLVSGPDGFTVNIFKSNDANGQIWSGNNKVTYNSRNPNDYAKYDHLNHHDGFVLNEDELTRAGIAVNDDIGKSTAYKGEVVALTNMLVSQFTALEEGVKDHIDSIIWGGVALSVSGIPGIDTLVSLTPSTGTVGGIDASANAYWRNIARTGLATTQAALLDALEQSKRDIQRKKGRFNFIGCGAEFYDALRNAVIASNTTQITYGSGSKLRIDMATDTIKFDNVPLTYIPAFDDNFGAGGAADWTKRCYMLNLGDSIEMHKDSADFMKMRHPGRPIDQYTYHWAMTSKFAMACRKRVSNAVLKLA